MSGTCAGVWTRPPQTTRIQTVNESESGFVTDRRNTDDHFAENCQVCLAGSPVCRMTHDVTEAAHVVIVGGDFGGLSCARVVVSCGDGSGNAGATVGTTGQSQGSLAPSLASLPT